MWTRIVLSLEDSTRADDLAAELVDLGAAGCEVRDAETFSEFEQSSFARAPKGASLIGFFPPEADPAPLSAWLRQLEGVSIESVQPFDDQEWREGWRQFFRYSRLTPRVAVRPSWDHAQPADPAPVVLVLDPGMAFGTGTHATTQLCLAALDSHLSERPDSRVLDVGCGSGILALAAARLGAPLVLGVDNDPEAVRVACENWEANGLGPAADAPFSTGALERLEPRWDLILANILAPVLRALRPDLVRLLAPGGRLVVSGLLAQERDAFAATFAAAPLRLERVDELDGWVALILRVA